MDVGKTPEVPLRLRQSQGDMPVPEPREPDAPESFLSQGSGARRQEDAVEIRSARRHHGPDEDCGDARGMRGHRHRNADGRLQVKRGDTHLLSLEKEVGEFSARPDNTHLSELRKLTGEVGVRKVAKKMKEIERVEIPENRGGLNPPYLADIE